MFRLHQVVHMVVQPCNVWVFDSCGYGPYCDASERGLQCFQHSPPPQRRHGGVSRAAGGRGRRMHDIRANIISQ